MNPDQETIQGELGTRLDEYLTRITPFGFAGAVLVARDGQILLNKGYGAADRTTGRLNTADTIFNTGSVTKQFTAAAIMKLAMQKRLDPQATLGRYLEGVPPDKAAVTLHHLLTHTAGVVNYTGEDYEMADREEMIDTALAAPLDFEPGTQYRYANAGFSLLAAVVEIVSEQPFESFVRQQLWQPAGMDFTGYLLPEWGQRPVARWYMGATDAGIPPLEQPYPSWHVMGNGEMLSTTGDMFRWYQALKGESILSAAAKEQLFTPFLDDYAYGWHVVNGDHGHLIQHDGASMFGSSAGCKWFVDADTLIVFFCNQSHHDGFPLVHILEDRLTSLVFSGDVMRPPQVQSRSEKELAQYSGRYHLPTSGHFQVTLQDGTLMVAAQGQAAINALAFQDEEADSYQAYNERLAQAFTAILEGNYELLAQELGHDQARLDRYRQYIQNHIRSYEKANAPIHQVNVLGTLPSHHPHSVATEIRLSGQKGSFNLRVYWRDGQFLGMSEGFAQQPFALPCLPLSADDFAVYHLGTGHMVKLRFNRDGQTVTGLTVTLNKQNLLAKRT